jgi:hypothetical protein
MMWGSTNLAGARICVIGRQLGLYNGARVSGLPRHEIEGADGELTAIEAGQHPLSIATSSISCPYLILKSRDLTDCAADAELGAFSLLTNSCQL